MTQKIKSFDLFAIPVQLTYNGQSAYFTLCGGCVSLILIIGLSTYFGLGVREAYINPRYSKSPAEFNYITQGGSIQPQYGNTLAVSIDNDSLDNVHEFFRVTFTIEDENEELSYPDAVWCDELYRDQIQKESEDD